MTNWLTDVRKKPKHVRDNIAFVAAGICTLPVLGYLVFGVHGPKLTAVEQSPAEDRKFFETFTSQFKEQMASVREATSNATTSNLGLPPVIDRGPLDAVPVLPEELLVETNNSQLMASTSLGATSSVPVTVR